MDVNLQVHDLEQLKCEVGQGPHLGLNVLLTDGVRRVGSRWRRTLHFLEQAGAAAYPGERLGARRRPRLSRADHRVGANRRTAWPEITQRSTFEVTPDLRLRIEPLDES
jgi:hypothetical protein